MNMFLINEYIRLIQDNYVMLKLDSFPKEKDFEFHSKEIKRIFLISCQKNP